MKRQQFGKSCLFLTGSVLAGGRGSILAEEDKSLPKKRPVIDHGVVSLVGSWNLQDGKLSFKSKEGPDAAALMAVCVRSAPKDRQLEKAALIFGKDCQTFDEFLRLDALSMKLLADVDFDPKGLGLKQEQFIPGFYVLYWAEFGV